jgi:erythronate-4-phosphate dehydrogenase
MIIIIDENIAFAKEAFSEFGEIKLVHGRDITNAALKDAEALIVRSITKVNEALLKDTPVKFVGTATIGTDHVDLEYLKSNNITFADAKGCNADAVAEYVFTSIFYLCVKNNIKLKNKTIGIVGVGNIGSRIERLANAIGLNIIKNDPPLKRKTGDNSFKELEEVFDADIITLHVPLNREGKDRTIHLFDENNLKMLKDRVIFINASRGQVVDNEALNKIIPLKNLLVTLDVWENEPNVNLDLLENVKLATPHIAGYSLEGKVNGTTMIYNSFCKFLNIAPKWEPEFPKVENNLINEPDIDSFEGKLEAVFTKIYNIVNDDKNMREIFKQPPEERGKYFDLLRKNYPLRREFINYHLSPSFKDVRLFNILKAFRFR